MGYAPYAAVGRIKSKQKNQNVSGYFIGSGTVIQPSSVLTAGHVLYNVDTTYGSVGFQTNMRFERARYGDSIASISYPVRKVLLAGYQNTATKKGANSNAAFNKDIGGLLFNNEPADGAYLGWWSNPALLNRSDVKPKWSLGYGAQYHDGKHLLRSQAGSDYGQVTSAFWANFSYLIEGGMSGGPVVTKTLGSNGEWYVIGVNVAGYYILSSDGSTQIPIGMGVHVIDSVAYNFITTTLY